MTFNDVMEFTRTVSSHAAFEDASCRALYDAVANLPRVSTIVEVGVEYGRSTSILAQVAKANAHLLVLIDPFVDPQSRHAFVIMMERVGYPYLLHHMKTSEVEADGIPATIGLLHIDGSHDAADVAIDCERLLSRVVHGGYACFHDYGRDSLPDVMPTVDKYVRNDEWQEVGLFDTLLVMRRK